MRDIDRLLRESLTAEANGYEPPDPDAAASEFMRKRGRRRWVRGGGAAMVAAAAAVALFALVQPEVVSDREPGPHPAGLQVIQRYRVAEEPLAIAGAPSGVWVASREGGAITQIDPATGSTEEFVLEGASQVVTAGDVAWAAGPGRVIEIEPGSGSGTAVIDFPPDLVDMAAGGRDRPVWLVTRSGCVADVSDLADAVCIGPEAFHATDVATTAKETWVLDGATGDLHQLHAEPGVNEGRGVVDGDAPIPTAPAGRYADLLLSTGGGRDLLWASGEGGQLMRLDLVTGDRSLTQLEGDYADLAAGYDSVWALVGHEGSDRGELVEIDLATGEPTGVPYSMGGKPSDVYAGDDGVWVTLRETNEVVRIAQGDAEPAPVETAEEAPSPDEDDQLARPLGPEDLVMVFSGHGRRGGEVYAMFGDGRTEPVTTPIAADLYPSFVRALYSEGPAVVLERRDLKTLDSELLYVDVPTGEETELVPGSLPAMSPDGQLAYWRMENESATLFITEVGTDFERQVPLTRGLPTSIAWDAAGRFVYVTETATDQSGEETSTVSSYDSTGELASVQLSPGPNARYVGPSSREPDTVHLIRIESDADDSDGPIDFIKLAEVAAVSSDPGGYTELISLGGLGIDESALRPENLRLEATGTLDAVVDDDGRITWGIGDERSWIIGFRTQAWLVKESGEIVPLGEFANGGLAVAPDLLER